MTDSWNNEVNSLFTVVTPPSLYFPTKGPKIFLAGSIDQGKAKNWQKEVIEFLGRNWTDIDITVFNPRMADGEFTDDQESMIHAWSISMLNAADYILMHLAGGTGVSPTSLLELGLFLKTDKIFLSIDPDYPRKYVVEVHYSYFSNRDIFTTPFESVNAIKTDWFWKKGTQHAKK